MAYKQPVYSNPSCSPNTFIYLDQLLYLHIEPHLPASSPGRPGGGAGKEGELAATSLEFEYLHSKSLCEMLIGGDDISNDVINWHLFFNVCVLSCLFWYIAGNLTASQQEASGELEVEIFKFQRHSCKLYFLFPPRHQSTLELEAHSQAKLNPVKMLSPSPSIMIGLI